MQVAISVFGRFHAFYLAQQLHKRNALARLLTSYPRFEVTHYGVPARKTTSLLPLELVRRFPWHPRVASNWMFDQVVAKRLKREADLFVGWSGSSLASLKKAKSLGMLTVVERGSAHIATQTSLLVEEYDKFGLKFRGTPQGIIERELAEYELADFISVPSSFAKRTFLEQGVREDKIIQVPLGVSVSEFRKHERRDQKFRFLFCGALDLRKGLPYLLEAFTSAKFPDAELWFVGPISPELEPVLAKYAHEYPQIVVHGPKRQRELPYYYSQASVFCLPSIEDGFGMVIPQAMACGLPVLCSANTAGEDLVRNGIEGFVTKARDVDALKEKMVWCYEHPDQCYAMGQAARERVRNGFTWDDYGGRIYFEYCRAYEVERSRLENSRGAKSSVSRPAAAS